MTKRLRAKPLPHGARAVMASRKERVDLADFYPTPPWATRALCEIVLPHAGVVIPSARIAWEPACGEGHMEDVLREYFVGVVASDIHDYGRDDAEVWDFLTPEPTGHVGYPFFDHRGPDWIITNPPFVRSLEFTRRALDLARSGVAMFVRTQWATEGIGRYEYLWRDRPPTRMAFFSERVPLCKGKWDPTGGTATAYCWLVWVHGREPMAPFWIPPGQRKALTHPDDIARFAAWSIPQQEAAE